MSVPVVGRAGGPPMGKPYYTAEDFAYSPFVAFYEVTRACDLVCEHCRACAQPKSHPHELNTDQSKRLIEQFATFPKPPVLVFTGGDPMKRADIFELIAHARDCGLTTAMTPSATPLVTAEAVRKMHDSGISRLALSLDGIDAATHDAFRGVAGSFARTMEILEYAHECELPVQINTTVARHNYQQLPDLAALLETLGIVLWSVFFLIPVGRGQAEQRLNAAQCEEVFEVLWQESQRRPYGIKTTEAHHYRRFVLQRAGNPQEHPGGVPKGRIQRAPIGVNDGRGVMFVSHTGSVFPSGFMPIRCGSFIEDSIVNIYQNSAMFRALRSPELLKDKCGACEFRSICGGSRARAYALTRDPLAAEPDCAYLPRLWSEKTQRNLTEKSMKISLEAAHA